MTDLKTIPAQDDFETTLSASWNGGTGTMRVFDVPDGELPTGEFSYVVVEPGTSNMQVAKISGWTKSPKAFIISSIDVEKSYGVNYTAKTHPANSVVRVSNNFAFWKEIQSAINSKVDPEDLGDYSFSGNEVSVIGDTVKMVANGSGVTLESSEKLYLKDKDAGPVSILQMIHPAGSGTETSVMTEEDYQDIPTPTVNTLYLTSKDIAGNVITKGHINGADYDLGGKADIHGQIENNDLNNNDEFVIADSNASYGNKKIKAGTVLDIMCSKVFDVRGDGSDGECIITQDTTMCAKEYNFTNFKVCSGVTVNFCGEGIPVIKAQCCIDNQGVIDLKSRNISCSYTELMFGVGCVCKVGTVPYSMCDIIPEQGGSGGGISGAGGGPGENGCNGEGGEYGGQGGTGAECAGGGGGSGGCSTQCGNNGCNATACRGGDGADGTTWAASGGGGGGYGYCKGGNGGNVKLLNAGNGGNSYCRGGNGGAKTCTTSCGGTGGKGGDAYYYGGNGGNTCGNCALGGDGGIGYYCKGGDGGSACNLNCCKTIGGKGGDSYLGCGGNGGNGELAGNGGYGYIKGGDGGCGCVQYASFDGGGGKGGDSYLQGGKGGDWGRGNGRYHYAGDGGNSCMGMYGIILSGGDVTSCCITGCGGNGGNGGNTEYSLNNCLDATKGKGGNGGDGADVMVIYKNSADICCIENKGGQGGIGGKYYCGPSCSNCVLGTSNNGCDGRNGLCSIIHFSN